MSQDTNLTSLIINKMTKSQYDSLQTKSSSELYFITDNSGLIAGTGLSLNGYTLNHTNTVVSSTIGSSQASSGTTISIPYFTYDAQGHITAGGTHNHTISIPVSSVNGDTGTVVVSKIKTTSIGDNTEYSLIGTLTSDSNTSPETVYQSNMLSFSKSSSTGATLSLGTPTAPGHFILYSNVSSASGYTELISGTTSTNTRTITFPDATGTVALTTDIPTISSWALAANKPSYTFSELTSTPASLGGYGITDAYTKTEIDGMVSGVLHYKGTKANVSELPNSGNATGDVWHITADGSEHAWDGSVWQELGTATDLSGYVPTSRTINNKALTSNISLTASDVGALANTTTYVSSFNGNTGDITYTAPVTSVNGKTGAVTVTEDDQTWNGVSLAKQSMTSSAETAYIPLATSTSPVNMSFGAVTRTPTANQMVKYDQNAYLHSTTPSASDNSTKVATTAYVDAAIPSVPSWALESSKPTYTASEVGAMSTSHAANDITTTNISDWNKSSGLWSVSSGHSSENYWWTLSLTQSGLWRYSNAPGLSGALRTITIPAYNNGNTTSIQLTVPTSSGTIALTSQIKTYTLSISGNRITLTPSSGTASYIDLPVYDGGVE